MRPIAWLAATLLLAACAAPPPAQEGLKPEWRPSPSFGERRPNFVILHHTSSATLEHALGVLTDPRSGSSAHYLIARDGRLLQLVEVSQRAWHAGASYWGGSTDLNSASIGIELDNDGEEPFAEPQIAKLMLLLADLRERYGIPTANFLGHGDVAPRRKSDPNRRFPWQRLAAQGFGLWCDPPGRASPDDGTLMLQAFGYDMADPAAAAAAFRRHFRAEDRAGDLDDAERAVLACLLDLKNR